MRPGAAAAAALLLLAAAPARADYRAGIAAYHGGDFATALSQFQAVAETDPRAQVALGILHARGDGVAKDVERAAGWFRQAAEAGNADGQYHYARMLHTGTGVAQDKAASAAAFGKAAEQGHIGAMHALSLILEQGDGVPADLARAAELARETANAGVPGDQYRLAQMYAEGRGVAGDPAEAYFWMYLAARNGVPRAEAAIGALRERLSPAEATAQEQRADAWSPLFRNTD